MENQYSDCGALPECNNALSSGNYLQKNLKTFNRKWRLSNIQNQFQVRQHFNIHDKQSSETIICLAPRHT